MNFRKIFFVFVSAIAVFFCFPFFIHNEIFDRFNLTIPETKSYAKVEKNTQKYFNVQAYDAKTGKKLPYRITRVGGYDPSKQYIKIDHRGQYVKKIQYVSKREFNKKVNKN